MANNLNQELEGKFVVLKAEEYGKDQLKRIFFCRGGFGTSPKTSGSAIFGYFVFDGEDCRVEGYEIERFATGGEVEEAEKFRGK
ncbi:MAG TPA: hypothetical protein VJA86_00325 [Candidatus Nanoarchaeia archaeon]|nr:hypothetical protein [Candidatus Nanoarchaeia archaeon]